MSATDESRVQTQNYRGEWVPAIPMPFFGRRKECRCGRKFWTMEGYEGHYAYAHILGMVPPPTGVPKGDRAPRSPRDGSA